MLPQDRMTEEAAASLFIVSMITETQCAWPDIKHSIVSCFKDRIIFSMSDKDASHELALAVIAMDMGCLKNLFANEQAARIEKQIIECLADLEYKAQYSVNKVQKYDRALTKCSEEIEKYGNPAHLLAGLLLTEWLGKNIDNIEVEWNGRKTGYLDPLVIGFVGHIVVRFIGIWKKVKDGIELIEAK